MPGSRFSTLCGQFTAAATDPAADADLLARFAAGRDEAAFAALVRRHGPMVWGVCRHLLPNPADADDAFQATFLALVRGAKAVRRPEALGGWLHGVAVRVANKLKRSAARRHQREQKVATGEASSPVADSRWDETLAAVHEEIGRLPDGERVAFVVCCLEGVRQPDAAERLGWKPGTLTGRLTRAKQRLLDRLTKRGLAPAAAAAAVGLGAATGQALVPVNLFDTAVAFASSSAAVPASILQLSQGVLDMTLTKVKLLAAAVIVAAGLGSGFGAGFLSNADAQSAPPGSAPPARPAAPPGGGPGPGAAPAPMAMPGGPAVMGGGLAPGITGGIARGPAVRPWDYKLVDVAPLTVEQMKKLLIDEGNLGWELVTIEHRQFNGSGGVEHLAIFKKSKPMSVGGTGSTAPAIGGAGVGGIGGAATIGGPGMGSSSGPASVGGGPPGGMMGTPAPSPKSTLYTITLKNAPSAQMAKVFKELISINELAGVTAVIADEGSNSLLVKATPDGFDAVRALAAKLEDAAVKADDTGRKTDTPKRGRP